MRDKESSVARRVIDLEANELYICNPQPEERLIPYFATKVQKLTDFSKQHFPQCCFLNKLLVNRDSKKSRAYFLIYIRLKPGIPCVLLQFIPKYSTKERNCLDNINLLLSQLSLKLKRISKFKTVIISP